jgi:hypothetical protein
VKRIENGRVIRTGLVDADEAMEILELARADGYSLGSVVYRLATTVICLYVRLDSMHREEV